MKKVIFFRHTYYSHKPCLIYFVAFLDLLLSPSWLLRQLKKKFLDQHKIVHLRRILIMRTDNIGDVVLSTGIPQQLKNIFPQANIDFLIKPACASLLTGNPHINDVITINLPWMSRLEETANYWDLLKMIFFLRKKKYDLVIELRGHPLNILFARSLSPKIVLGYTHQGGRFLSDISPEYFLPLHEIDKHDLLLRALFAKLQYRSVTFSCSPKLFLNNREMAYCKTTLHTTQSHIHIMIHPFSSWPYKNYPLAHWTIVARLLLAHYPFSKIFIASSAKDFSTVKNLADHLCTDYPHRVVALPSGTLRDLITRIYSMNLFIGNDSGPAHIASALSTPSVVLFGAQSPHLFGPPGKNVISLYKKEPCSPCLQEKMINGCPFHTTTCRGLINILPEEIFRACHDLIEKTSRHKTHI